MAQIDGLCHFFEKNIKLPNTKISQLRNVKESALRMQIFGFDVIFSK